MRAYIFLIHLPPRDGAYGNSASECMPTYVRTFARLYVHRFKKLAPFTSWLPTHKSCSPFHKLATTTQELLTPFTSWLPTHESCSPLHKLATTSQELLFTSASTTRRLDVPRLRPHTETQLLHLLPASSHVLLQREHGRPRQRLLQHLGEKSSS